MVAEVIWVLGFCFYLGFGYIILLCRNITLMCYIVK